MATDAKPLRDLHPGDQIKTNIGILTIKHIEKLARYNEDLIPQRRLFFEETEETRTYGEDKCLHKILPTQPETHSTLGRGQSTFSGFTGTRF